MDIFIDMKAPFENHNDYYKDENPWLKVSVPKRDELEKLMLEQKRKIKGIVIAHPFPIHELER